MDMPKKINPRWLHQQHNWLSVTAKEINGQPNPRYTALAAEIAEAEREVARWDAFHAWVKDNLNATPSRVKVETPQQTYQRGETFIGTTNGEQKIYTIAGAWKRYVAAVGEVA